MSAAAKEKEKEKDKEKDKDKQNTGPAPITFIPSWTITPVDPEGNKAILDALMCYICTNLAWDACRASCGHIVCKDCIKQNFTVAKDHLERGQLKCGKCKVPHKLSAYQPLAEVETNAARMLGNIEIFCPAYVEAGCQWKGAYSSAKDHIDKTCAFASVVCEVCQKHYSKTDMPQHRKICKRKLRCLRCYSNYFEGEWDSHASACLHTKILCPLGCELYLEQLWMVDHTMNECPNQYLPCPVPTCGVIKRKDMLEHLADEKLHLSALVPKTASQTLADCTKALLKAGAAAFKLQQARRFPIMLCPICPAPHSIMTLRHGDSMQRDRSTHAPHGWRQRLKINDLVNVWDGTRTFAAQVIVIEEKRIRVSYMHFTDSYDEWLNKDSTRIMWMPLHLQQEFVVKPVPVPAATTQPTQPIATPSTQPIATQPVAQHCVMHGCTRPGDPELLRTSGLNICRPCGGLPDMSESYEDSVDLLPDLVGLARPPPTPIEACRRCRKPMVSQVYYHCATCQFCLCQTCLLLDKQRIEGPLMSQRPEQLLNQGRNRLAEYKYHDVPQPRRSERLHGRLPLPIPVDGMGGALFGNMMPHAAGAAAAAVEAVNPQQHPFQATIDRLRQEIGAENVIITRHGFPEGADPDDLDFFLNNPPPPPAPRQPSRNPDDGRSRRNRGPTNQE